MGLNDATPILMSFSNLPRGGLAGSLSEDSQEMCLVCSLMDPGTACPGPGAFPETDLRFYVLDTFFFFYQLDKGFWCEPAFTVTEGVYAFRFHE